jgi:hypothetical protein
MTKHDVDMLIQVFSDAIVQADAVNIVYTKTQHGGVRLVADMLVDKLAKQGYNADNIIAEMYGIVIKKRTKLNEGGKTWMNS